MTQNSAVYCWFDWDDDTTSVNSLNIVKEPRKPWNKYFPGEEITANLPKYDLLKGVIVEISESKKDLEKKMKDRQQLQAEMVQGETSQCKTDKTAKRKGKEDKTRNSTENDNERVEEKRRNKELDRNKLEAVNKQLEEIVQKRHLGGISALNSNDAGNENSPSAEIDTINEQNLTLQLDSNEKEAGNLPNTEIDNRTRYDLTPYAEIWPYITQSYSFLEDLYRSPSTSYQTLQTRREQFSDMHLKNKELEDENRKLKEDMFRLKQEVEILKSGATMLSGLPAATPRKINFLKQLTSVLENQRSSVMTANDETVLHTDIPLRPVRLLFSRPEPQAELASGQSQMEDNTSDEKDSRAESVALITWEESQTSNGNPKIRLLAAFDVFLAQAQLSQANHKASGNPRKLVIALLDIFFKRDMLARSSAHNKKDDYMSIPLPATVVTAVKQYVLQVYKKPNGEPCLSDTIFNDVINQKCATARSLKC